MVRNFIIFFIGQIMISFSVHMSLKKSKKSIFLKSINFSVLNLFYGLPSFLKILSLTLFLITCYKHLHFQLFLWKNLSSYSQIELFVYFKGQLILYSNYSIYFYSFFISVGTRNTFRRALSFTFGKRMKNLTAVVTFINKVLYY